MIFHITRTDISRIYLVISNVYQNINNRYFNKHTFKLRMNNFENEVGKTKQNLFSQHNFRKLLFERYVTNKVNLYTQS